MIAQYWGQYVTRYQAGYTVPITPEAFKKALEGEQTAGPKFGYDWTETPEVVADLIFQSLIAYIQVYGTYIQAPLPSNPLPEFEAWFNSTHPFVGTVSGQ